MAGWGEGRRLYWPDQPHGEAQVATGPPSQTAWALLALMAAGGSVIPDGVARAYAISSRRSG